MLTLMTLVRYLKKVGIARLDQIQSEFPDALTESMLDWLESHNHVTTHDLKHPVTGVQRVYCWNRSLEH